TFYVLSRQDHRDNIALFLYDFENNKYLEEVASVDGLDIDDVWLNEARQVERVSYTKHTTRFVFEDPVAQAHYDALVDGFGQDTLISLIDESEISKRWLIRVSAPDRLPEDYLYDLENKKLTFIGRQKSWFEDIKLAPMTVIDYTASDGTSLHGYLTGHPIKDGASPRPLIIMPHGGPEARDRLQFNETVQLLASYGYQVFQPNFRGSSGFGSSFARAGDRQWGKKMQTDIYDGIDHLISEGLATERNMCMVGGSYGGYASFMGLIQQPERYKCGVAIAAPSDLLDILSWQNRKSQDAQDYWTRHIGHPRRDRDAIKAVSPIELVDQIQAPLLIIHGEEDTVIPVRQSRNLKRALDKAGIDFTYLELRKSNHTLRALSDERQEMEAILQFLEKHIPAD
ncbi:MAG: prolyl oligopeptidase family serine peptidase, partial [Pseudomonadota bacterium]